MTITATTDVRVRIKTEEEPLSRLALMLEYRRPAGSRTEKAFIMYWITSQFEGVQTDKAGNLYKRIGTAPILWSAHTDTVHRQGGTQRLWLDKDNKLSTKDRESNCLGADDTAGVWLLTEMMRAGVEGLYVFHRGEERGGVGSRWLVTHTPELVKDIQCAIAFDRRGIDSVITHQSGGRCCSDDFGNSLKDILNEGTAFKYRLDTGGSFTDTANYTGLIGECTNVSIGYRFEHQRSEELDVTHCKNLREKMIKADLTKLVYSRKPGEKEAVNYSGGSKSGGYGSTIYSVQRHGTWGYYDLHGRFVPYNNQGAFKRKQKASAQGQNQKGQVRGFKSDDVSDWDREDFIYGGYDPDDWDKAQERYDTYVKSTLSDLVRLNHAPVADLLEELGYDATSLRADILSRASVVYHPAGSTVSYKGGTTGTK